MLGKRLKSTESLFGRGKHEFRVPFDVKAEIPLPKPRSEPLENNAIALSCEASDDQKSPEQSATPNDVYPEPISESLGAFSSSDSEAAASDVSHLDTT